MPAHLVIQAYSKLSLKKAEEINYLNYSASYTAAIAQTEPGKQIDNKNWLPFRIKDLIISRALAFEILEADLPIGCEADLENSGILAQCKELVK